MILKPGEFTEKPRATGVIIPKGDYFDNPPAGMRDSVAENQKPGAIEAFNMGFAQKPLPENSGIVANVAHAGGEYGLPILGSVAGSPGGPAGIAAGAAAGRAVQKATTQAILPNLAPKESDLSVITDVAGQAAAQLAAGAVSDKLEAAQSAIAKHIPDSVKKVADNVAQKFQKTGAQMLKMLTGVREKTGLAVMKNPDILNTAPSMEEAGKTFKAGIEAVGLKTGPEGALQETGKMALSQQAAVDFANDAFSDMANGTLTPQKAIVAREQLSDILSMPKFQNPDRAKMERVLIQMKDKFDDYLEPVFNEKGASYESMRSDYHAAMVKKTFSSLLPQNQNMGASVLRGLGSIGVAEYGREKQSPALMLGGLLATSPYFAGKVIQAATLPKMLAEPAFKAAFSAMADELKTTPELIAKGIAKEATDHPEIPKQYLPHLVADEIAASGPEFYEKEAK